MSLPTATTSTSLPDPIKVAIIEDQRTIREGLAALIGGTDGFSCTGSYGSMEEALKKIGLKAEDVPDVALVDIGLPGMSGIEGIGLLRELYPAMPVLMLTVYKDDDRIFKAICAGARGYLMKQEGPENILRAMRQVLDGQTYVSERMSVRILNVFSGRSDKARSPIARLSDREFEILQLIGQGKDSSAIAKHLHVSSKTVDAHRGHIKEKLNLKNGTELIYYAVRWVGAQQQSMPE